MSHKVDIHQAQTEILRSLLFSKDASYTQLCESTGLSSDHFNFHIKKLVELGYVEKLDKNYSLTPAGKEYSNQLDTEDRTIEKQPKTAVLVLPTRIRADGKMEFLVQKRLKQPFYGFFMCLTGKVRWGEELIETAARELDEETGLEANKLELMTIYHKMDYNKDTKDLLEDKIFYCYNATNLTGKMKQSFEGGENHWLSLDEISKLKKTLLDASELADWVAPKPLTFNEFKYYYNKSEY